MSDRYGVEIQVFQYTYMGDRDDKRCVGAAVGDNETDWLVALRSAVDQLIGEEVSDSFFNRSKLSALVQEGLTTDGEHHKQWFLERVAQLCGLDVTGYEPGIAP